MTPSSTVVFFGSGPVAAATLKGLFGAGLSFEAVITKPRARGYRGSVPVLELAEALKIPAFTPQNKHELSAFFAQHSFKSPVGLVVDYGIIIAKEVISAFPKGIVNSHFSLLPEWRGADPITFAILSGQLKTGVSLMLINEKLDEGDLLAQETVDLNPTITAPDLTLKLIDISNKMIISNLAGYLSGDIKPYKQPSQGVTYSRMLTKQDGNIALNKPAQQLEREVRAFRGWPKSQLKLFGKYPVVILQARVAKNLADGKLVLSCGNKTYLEIIELIAPSGKTMSGDAFLRGYRQTS